MYQQAKAKCIRNQRRTITAIHRNTECVVQDVTPTPAQIKEAFNLKTKGEKKENHEEKQKVELDFMKVFNEFVAECSKQNDWSSSTLKKFATVKKHIYTFDPNTTFDSWTEKHFNDQTNQIRKMVLTLE